jgi:hypothetical protein
MEGSLEITLQISEKTSQLILTCKCCLTELHEANKTEEGRCKKETDLKKEMLYIYKRCKKELEESTARTEDSEGAQRRLRQELDAELNANWRSYTIAEQG